MSFPKITTRQHLKSRSNRLGVEFRKRIERGFLVDRTQTKRPKEVKTVKAPDALAKFFIPIQF